MLWLHVFLLMEGAAEQYETELEGHVTVWQLQQLDRYSKFIACVDLASSRTLMSGALLQFVV
jgi:hypothetical protein